MDIKDLVQLGSAAGAVVMAWMFLKFLTEERKELSNHLSATVKVLQRLADDQDEHRKRTEKE